MTNFNWKDKETELETIIAKCVKDHNDFINSKFGQFMAQGDKDFGKDWTTVFWWSGTQIEFYDKEQETTQELIDFYHFSKARTRVILRCTGEDITDEYIFNPLYRDIFKDERLEQKR